MQNHCVESYKFIMGLDIKCNLALEYYLMSFTIELDTLIVKKVVLHMLICFHNSEKIKVDSYEKHLEKTSTFDKGITLASQFLIKIKISISIIYS